MSVFRKCDTRVPFHLILSLALLLFSLCARPVAAEQASDLRIVGIDGVTAEAPQSGAFYPIAITLSPGPAQAHSIDLRPEIKITLMDLDRSYEVSTKGDPVAARFLGAPPAEGDSVTWPATFTPGAVADDPQDPNHWHWIPLPRRQMGFAPPSSGKFILRATMRLREGGALTHFDREFTVTGKRLIGDGLFGLVGSTMRIIASQLPYEKALEEETAIRYELESHRIERAAQMMGKRMGSIFANSKVHSLGRYVEALTTSSASDEGLAQFLKPFLDGYGRQGVLIIPREGVRAWRAVSSRGVEYTAAPDKLAVPLSRARLFVGKKMIVIPYSTLETISVTLTGSGTKPVKVWQVLPGRASSAAYPAEKWNKRFTVQPGKPAF